MKEQEIRPRDLFDAYLAAVREDIDAFFADKSGFREADCPACGGRERREALVKDGFRYAECLACRTLFVTPRPTRDALDRFYRESKSSRFWVERFYKETEEARREKMFRPRALEVRDQAARRLPGRRPSVVDVGSGYGTFLEELRRLDFFSEVAGLEPSAGLAEICEKKGFPVVRSTAEDAPVRDRFDVATSFELFEHVHAPVDFLSAVRRLLKPGGLLYMTTLNGKGFDLLLLGGASKSLSPPHHINFINPGSLRTALERAGFQVLEIGTPGKLDVDIALNAPAARSAADPFTKWLLYDTEDSVRANFQRFLQENGLSSHIRAVARRPDGGGAA